MKLNQKLLSIDGGKGVTPLETIKRSAIGERENNCPVRGRKVKEYLLPLGLVRVDALSQNREKDSDPKNVSILAEEISNVGQILGICAELKLVDNKIFAFVRWGNTRHRALEKISDDEVFSDNRKIPGISKEGYIWVSIYNEKPSLLKRLQAKENNLHPHNTPANLEDNIRSMEDIIRDGLLDYEGKKYKDCSDSEKKERFKKEVKSTMPHWGGRRFVGFWNRFKKKNSQDFQVKTWDTGKAKKHFIKSNPFEVKSMSEALPENGRTTFNCVYVKNNKKIEEKIGFQWFIGRSSVSDGAFLQGSYSHKYIDKSAENVVWVVSLNVGQRVSLSDARQNLINGCKRWNNTLPKDMKFVDKLLFLPQTEPEKTSDKHYAMVVDL